MHLTVALKKRFSTVGGVFSALVPVGALAMVGYLVLTKGSSFRAAFSGTAVGAGGAVAAHLPTLALRTEAWRVALPTVSQL
jgi:hypothetical protein